MYPSESEIWDIINKWIAHYNLPETTTLKAAMYSSICEVFSKVEKGTR